MYSRTARIYHIATLALAAGLVACSHDSGTDVQIAPAQLTIVAGSNAQSGPVGSALPPVSVEVQAASGTPLAGQVVNWTVVSGGGVVSAPTSVTDSNGIASVTWVLGPVTGADSLNAGVNGTSLSVNLSATAIAP